MDDFARSDVAEVFDAYPRAIKRKLLRLRRLIFETAKKTDGVGDIEETLKWGQPSYLTSATKSGSTIRIDQVKNGSADYAMYFHCQTSLVDSFRVLFGDTFRYEKNRAILFNLDEEIAIEALRECVVMALTYHRAR